MEWALNVMSVALEIEKGNGDREKRCDVKTRNRSEAEQPRKLTESTGGRGLAPASGLQRGPTRGLCISCLQDTTGYISFVLSHGLWSLS